MNKTTKLIKHFSNWTIIFTLLFVTASCASSTSRKETQQRRVRARPLKNNSGEFDNSQIVATDKVLNDEEPVYYDNEFTTQLIEAMNGEEYCFEVYSAWREYCITYNVRRNSHEWASYQSALLRWQQASIDLADFQAGVPRNYQFVQVGSGGLPSNFHWTPGRFDSSGRYRWRVTAR